MPTCSGPLTGSLTGPSIFTNHKASEQASSSSSAINKQQTRRPLSHIYTDLQHRSLFLTRK